MSTQADYGKGNEEIDLTRFFQELLSYKWFLLMSILVGLVLGACYLASQPAQYQSNVLLQVDSNKNVGKMSAFTEQLFMGAGGGDSADTQMALIQSRFILDPVIESLGLDIRISGRKKSLKDYLFLSHVQKEPKVTRFNAPKEALNKPFSLVVKSARDVELYDYKKQLVLSGPIGERLVSSKYNIQLQLAKEGLPVGSHFKLVKLSKNKVFENLSSRLKLEEVGSNKGGMARGGTGIIQISLKGKDKEQVLRILDAIAETTRLKDAEKKSKEALQTTEFLEQQLPITKSLLEESEQKLNKYRARSGKIDIKIQTKFLLSQLAELDNKLSALQIKEIGMQQQYKKTHPLWVSLDAQKKVLEQQRSQLELELKKLPASDQVAVNLMRDVTVKQELYMLLLNKIQELEVVKAGTISGVSILSYAPLPDSPIPIRNKVILLGYGFLAFITGVILIYGRKILSPRVEDPHWGEKHLDLPNVAIVPFCKEQVIEPLSVSKNSLPLLAHTYPKNLAVEALRSLRTSLQVTFACANNNVISILGVSPGVGKSFVSANLAYLLAAAGKRVLLIDSDLRKGTLHKYFDLKPSPGLAELLVDSSEVLLDDVRVIGIKHENLTVIPRGHYPKSPSELLASQQFKKIMKEVSTQYDIVLFDTPPILLVTDALLVSAFSDTNFLVVGAGVHQPKEIELAYKRLNNANISLNGSIFNFHKEKRAQTYYGKYYNYSYYYGEDEKT
ncbi:MAG: polysaccharide biosynthesis tyrosine autokinase [Legionellaceae bacterium]|nr:polysaccharide biosynthesis tyrosine autokinase [Legionellaceae bacterium]